MLPVDEMFAPFCTEGASQYDEPWKVYSAYSAYSAFPAYAVFRRDGSGIVTEIVGIKHRPWLEGRMSIENSAPDVHFTPRVIYDEDD